jgi:hypothetical protein
MEEQEDDEKYQKIIIYKKNYRKSWTLSIGSRKNQIRYKNY